MKPNIISKVILVKSSLILLCWSNVTGIISTSHILVSLNELQLDIKCMYVAIIIHRCLPSKYLHPGASAILWPPLWQLCFNVTSYSQAHWGGWSKKEKKKEKLAGSTLAKEKKIYYPANDCMIPDSSLITDKKETTPIILSNMVEIV